MRCTSRAGCGVVLYRTDLMPRREWIATVPFTTHVPRSSLMESPMATQDEVYTGEPEMSCTKLIAVHAGLEKTKGVEEQLKVLYNRDVTLPRVEALSGRKNVWDAPMELLENKVMLISGHHGTLHVDKLRLIIDEGGGFEQRPIAAIVFPSGTIIRDTDSQAKG